MVLLEIAPGIYLGVLHGMPLGISSKIVYRETSVEASTEISYEIPSGTPVRFRSVIPRIISQKYFLLLPPGILPRISL